MLEIEIRNSRLTYRSVIIATNHIGWRLSLSAQAKLSNYVVSRHWHLGRRSKIVAPKFNPKAPCKLNMLENVHTNGY